ncbi:rhodanese-like domain-containing protein [Tropicibacter naphthalenivorans]|uniref:Rhodanese-like domain protein n=1 Tax=Tropicibacter naphthalenivorans TaxID=441103 RepID=A0A0N7LZE9_9RHOB|nr:rhodanese-like domain-containing protein [Tropicibacter naphthalenivorans]CUH77473.1 Rhodanese-like domain protein [Tropicibacter naphthalenivorans]SMC57171.1 Rhodanese-related sulfurtransferase [Tropicibacter naphthalenivorans]
MFKVVFTALMLSAVPALAQDAVNITRDIASVTVPLPGGGSAEVSRNQDTTHRLEGDWALTSRPCPSFCIQPMIPAPGVTPIGELELLDLLQDPQVVVADGRIRSQFAEGTIPGAVSIPYLEAADRLDVLGCEVDFDGFDCAVEGLKKVALFCNGPWCGQSPTAARRMIEAGFPAENIYYYRGGMQMWRLFGLTVVPGT